MTSRRSLLRLLAAGAGAGLLPRLARADAATDLYALPPAGNVRILHLTDTHAQTRPLLFREPSSNIGIGAAAGRPPHLVGEAFLGHFGVPAGGHRAYGFTYLDFEEAAHRYGTLGGFAHIKALLDRLRAEAGPANTLTLDGGDLLQGSALANLTQGAALVELANMLGIEAMTGHWEFTYGEDQMRQNIAAFHGDFLAQNVFLTDEAAFNGAASFDAGSGRVFRPYVIKEAGGRRIAVIGQAFPYVPIAHPQRFVPEWSFGIHIAELQQTVDAARGKDRADAVVLLSHNGMDADLKLASLISGIDIILGGHTHDAVPQPSLIANPGGKTLVANGGSNGKFIGVVDLEIGAGRVGGVRYTLLPVFSNLLAPDEAVVGRIAQLHSPFEAGLQETLAHAGSLLYRRGNFDGTMDRVICDALRQQMDAEIALSPGFRWGPSVLPGAPITMDDLMGQTAISYPDVYTQTMTGAQIRTVIEDVCDNLFNPDPFLQQGGDMIRVGGMSYVCAPGNVMGQRISGLVLDNGTPVEAEKSYRVASWASVTLPQEGKPVWDVVATYLRALGTVTPSTTSQVRIEGVSGNPGYAAT